MVNLCKIICDFFHGKKQEDDKDRAIAGLVESIKSLIPYAESNLELKIAISNLERKLGTNKAYAGVY